MTTDLTAGNLEARGARGPRLLLTDHHREIEDACRALLARAYADDSATLIQQYRAFEHAILDHLMAEEELILPRYAEAAPLDARALLVEHAILRRLLLQVGVEVELHCVRASTLCALIDRLHAHAAREDAAMYPWAQVHLSLAAKRRLFVRVGRSLRRLARRAEAHVPTPLL